jgi:hypothetical protein
VAPQRCARTFPADRCDATVRPPTDRHRHRHRHRHRGQRHRHRGQRQGQRQRRRAGAASHRRLLVEQTRVVRPGPVASTGTEPALGAFLPPAHPPRLAAVDRLRQQPGPRPGRAAARAERRRTPPNAPRSLTRSRRSPRPGRPAAARHQRAVLGALLGPVPRRRPGRRRAGLPTPPTLAAARATAAAARPGKQTGRVPRVPRGRALPSRRSVLRRPPAGRSVCPFRRTSRRRVIRSSPSTLPVRAVAGSCGRSGPVPRAHGRRKVTPGSGGRPARPGQRLMPPTTWAGRGPASYARGCAAAATEHASTSGPAAARPAAARAPVASLLDRPGQQGSPAASRRAQRRLSRRRTPGCWVSRRRPAAATPCLLAGSPRGGRSAAPPGAAGPVAEGGVPSRASSGAGRRPVRYGTVCHPRHPRHPVRPGASASVSRNGTPARGTPARHRTRMPRSGAQSLQPGPAQRLSDTQGRRHGRASGRYVSV